MVLIQIQIQRITTSVTGGCDFGGCLPNYDLKKSGVSLKGESTQTQHVGSLEVAASKQHHLVYIQGHACTDEFKLPVKIGTVCGGVSASGAPNHLLYNPGQCQDLLSPKICLA